MLSSQQRPRCWKGSNIMSPNWNRSEVTLSTVLKGPLDEGHYPTRDNISGGCPVVTILICQKKLTDPWPQLLSYYQVILESSTRTPFVIFLPGRKLVHVRQKRGSTNIMDGLNLNQEAWLRNKSHPSLVPAFMTLLIVQRMKVASSPACGCGNEKHMVFHVKKIRSACYNGSKGLPNIFLRTSAKLRGGTKLLTGGLEIKKAFTKSVKSPELHTDTPFHPWCTEPMAALNPLIVLTARLLQRKDGSENSATSPTVARR